jgi:potassium efflux system protein
MNMYCLKRFKSAFIYGGIVLSWFIMLFYPLLSGAENQIIDSATVQQKLTALEGNTALDQETNNRLQKLYTSILDDLTSQKTFTQQSADYEALIETAPNEIKTLRKQLSKIQQQPTSPETLPAKTTVRDIEILLTAEQTELTTLEAQLSTIEKTLSDMVSNPSRDRQRLLDIKQSLEQLDTNALSTPSTSELSAAEQEANDWALKAKRARLQSEMVLIEQRISSVSIRQSLLEAQRDVAQAQLKAHQARRAWLENEADRLRRIEAERVQNETQAAAQALAHAHPLLKAQAERNAELSTWISHLTAQLDQLDEQLTLLETTRKRIETDFRITRQHLEIAGLSRILGQSLIDQRKLLPNRHSLHKGIAERADAISETSLMLIRFREERQELTNPSAWIATRLTDDSVSLNPAQRQELLTQIKQREALLQHCITIGESYVRGLGDLDEETQRLIQVAQDYEAFLAERLLWVRNIVPITAQNFASFGTALIWLVAPEQWYHAGIAFANQLWQTPLAWLPLVVVIAIALQRRVLRQYILDQSEPLRRVSTDRFSYTVKAFLLTVILALPIPLLFWYSGWFMNSIVETDPFAKALGHACMQLALVLYYIRIFYLLCIPGGVADRHFRWSSSIVTQLRQELTWATWLIVPLIFIAAIIYEQPNQDFISTAGRIIFIMLIISLSVFLARLIHPKSGVLQLWLKKNQQHLTYRLRNLWYPLVISIPLMLAALALAGYLYTAVTLLNSVLISLALIAQLIIVQQFIIRWLMLTRRNLTLKTTLERYTREEQTNTDDKFPDLEQEAIDFEALDEQTRRLMTSFIISAGAVGLWIIWSDVLPALNLFENITLWHYNTTVDGQQQLVPFTLSNLGLTLLVIALAIIATRNLPALLEIILLRHTAITAGSRYAIITLIGYGITAIAVLMTVNAIGLSWSQVQWLVAALSVGIGFGLQEIVANFISGLIILFERPIRVGDIVTIDNTTGQVVKINIRATTIRNWDKQDLLVPNKEFITGRLLNWTFTDKLNRITITVGAEYGSDTRLAIKLLTAAATEHPSVLTDPAPIVSFEGFGDNALTFVLRCYLDSLDNRLMIITDLHLAINDKFNAAGIGIAFPQRDLHLRSAVPLTVNWPSDIKQPTLDQAQGDAGHQP